MDGRAGYGARWRAVPRELLFLLLAFPIAVPGAIVTIVLFSTGVGAIVTVVISLAALVGALYFSRGFGAFELLRLQWAGRPGIARPDWQDERAGGGFFAWLRSVLGNGHYWLYLLDTMVVAFVVSLVSWTVTIACLSLIVAGVTGWFFDDDDGSNGTFAGMLSSVVGRIVLLLVAVVLAAALPFVTRVLVLMHWAVARGLLGAFRSDALQREVIAVTAARGAAISAEGTSLRRLERDIHDGPQQRLVRLQMDLAAADRQIATDPEKARETIAR